MKKCLILGCSGMLGSTVLKELNKVEDFLVEGTVRYGSYDDVESKYQDLVRKFADVTPDKIEQSYGSFSFFGQLISYIETARPDYIINAIGIIKPHSTRNPGLTAYVNGVFPHQLAELCSLYKVKLIHISSDCTFSGKSSSYNEQSLHDALDLYGKSKSIGEPIKDCMTIRTSIIGEEIHNNSSLIAWARSQVGNKVQGYTNHKWNGITTNHYAKVVTQIIKEDLWKEGIYHVFAKEPVTKYELLCLLNQYLMLDLSIEPVEAKESIDRTLSTIHDLNFKLNVPTVEEMIAEMAEENKKDE